MPTNVPSEEDDLEFEEFLAKLVVDVTPNVIGSNDSPESGPPQYNDTDVVVTSNDLDDEPDSDQQPITTNDLDECAVIIANVGGNFVFGPHTFGAPPENHSFTTCGFNNVVSFVGLGSFIFDINVDTDNRPLVTTREDTYTEINAGEVAIIRTSATNFKFNADPGQTATLLFQVAPLVTKPTETIVTDIEVCIPSSGCLTSNDDVRRFVLDRMVEDNEIDLELFFSDSEINYARALAVAMYNELPPYVDPIQLTDCNASCLPAPVMFLNGITYYMYLKKLQKLQKEDVDYQAGGMTVSIVKKRIAHIMGNLKIFKTEFENLAISRKTHINYSSAFGRVG